ncbi:hypothetical protein ACWCQL_29700 [Streptomyces sp. NPDC002073]|uniref:hypothetical protein n=1 Tax=Streptomyces sp. NBC_00239 TaxID=2903640 RepID=UPI002E28C28F|nr:hypothetical protein [Streptomyces sp. NBC_00239]
MARVVELATVMGSGSVDQALGLAATAGRFADEDLLSTLGHIAANRPDGEFVRADEAHSVHPTCPVVSLCHCRRARTAPAAFRRATRGIPAALADPCAGRAAAPRRRIGS